MTTPDPADKTLGRFGYHPDPAIDFCIEVEALEGMFVDAGCGHPDDDGQPITTDIVRDRVTRAMGFRVGGDQHAVAAKAVLRELGRSVFQ